MTDRIQLKKFYPNYFTFFLSGAMVLLVGAILPYLMTEANLSYTTAGTLLSAFAIGNFIASFIYPALTKFLGRKPAILLTSSFVPVILTVITFIPPVWAMIILFTILGISRGCYSIINNAYINENSDGSPFALNILHMTFAMGAFAAPMIMTVFFNFGFSWRAIVYTIALGTFFSVLLLSRLNLKQKPEAKQKIIKEDSASAAPFYRYPLFWISGLLLFFYLGLENCVNGWFVTYFRNSGIISESFSNSLVSFTWLAVLFGRLFTAMISTKIKKQFIILIDCIATALFFTLLISTQNITLITISIIGLGFFFAGIYATTVANAHDAIATSEFGTSMLLAIAALGGIITPQVVGSIADRTGLSGAIGTLMINTSAIIIFAVVNIVISKTKK